MSVNKILVVEDSAMVLKVLKHMMLQHSHLQPLYAQSFKEAKEVMAEHEDIFAAMVDLNLPDAPDGEVVDYTLGKKIPTLVLTGTFDNERRESLLSKGVVDYVTKEGRYSYGYAISVINRLVRNQHIKVLVADDSNTTRKFICNLLKLHLYQVVQAVDGVEAIKVLLENPDVKMLITDYNMPRMDGFELVQNIRCKYEKSDLVIIGLSADGESFLSARFIKNGANDFLKKPFNHEEFFCRITQHIEFIELINSVKDAANRDELTGVYNRHHFFDEGENKYLQAKSSGASLSAVIVGFDNLVEMNSTHGKEVGNLLIAHAAGILKSAFSRFFLARASEQEFFVLMPGLHNEKACEFVDRVRQLVIQSPIQLGGDTISLGMSAGVTNTLGESFDDMLAMASDCLMRASDAGGDMVCGDD